MVEREAVDGGCAGLLIGIGPERVVIGGRRTDPAGASRGRVRGAGDLWAFGDLGRVTE